MYVSQEIFKSRLKNSLLNFLRLLPSPPGISLSNVVHVKLLEYGTIALHSACISKDGEGVLLLAPGGTGKTLTALILSQRGFNILSEDITVLQDGRLALACPLTASFLYDDYSLRLLLERSFLNIRTLLRLKIRRILDISPLSYLYSPMVKIPENFRETYRVTQKVKISNIIILRRNTKRIISELNEEDAVRQILMINRLEFSYYRDPLLQAVACCFPKYNVKNLMRQESRIVEKVVQNSRCFILEARDSFEFARFILKLTNN